MIDLMERELNQPAFSIRSDTIRNAGGADLLSGQFRINNTSPVAGGSS